VEFFAGLPDFVLASVANIMEVVDVNPGETFIKVGNYDNCMYVIYDGQVEVTLQGQKLAKLESGTVVGEMELLASQSRSANVTALTETRLLELKADRFRDLMADYPEIAQGIIQVLVQRIRMSNERIRELTEKVSVL